MDFRKGVYCNSALPKSLQPLGLPNPREWRPSDADWKLPPDWKKTILDGMRDRLPQRAAEQRIFQRQLLELRSRVDRLLLPDVAHEALQLHAGLMQVHPDAVLVQLLIVLCPRPADHVQRISTRREISANTVMDTPAKLATFAINQ